MTETVEIIKPKRRKNPNRNYVNGPDLHDALIVYLDSIKKAENDGSESPRIPRYIGECIVLINKNLSKKYNFSGYSWVEEMVGAGIENCVRAVPNYDPTRATRNPFAYFTRIAWNAFIHRIKMEKREIYIKHKNMQVLFTEADLAGSFGVTSADDNGNRVISEFEEKIESAKTRKADKTRTKKMKGVEAFVE